MASTVTLPFPNPTTDDQYATDLDVMIGAPTPVDPAAVEVTSAWVQAESATFPGGNGLGTELYLPGATPDPSNPAVYDYATVQEGLQAAVDEIEGGGPQTSADAPQFARDVKSGKATVTQLVGDIRNSRWDGTPPDTYDADTVTSILNKAGISVAAKSSGSGGFDWDPLSWPGSVFRGAVAVPGEIVALPGKAIGDAAGTLAGDVGKYILKGILTLVGGGLMFYGATLFTTGKSPDQAAEELPGVSEITDPTGGIDPEELAA